MAKPMSDEQLTEIRAQLANWPRGYWLAGVKSASLIQNTSEMRERHEIAVISAEHTATIDLLTHAYTDMLALLAEVERLQAALDVHRLGLQKCADENERWRRARQPAWTGDEEEYPEDSGNPEMDI